MKAIVYHGTNDIRLDTVNEPKIEHPQDVIVRITASAICGTDLHFVRGTVPGMKPGTVLGHEGVGIVEATGPGVRNLRVGDRVVIPSTIACGSCVYCRTGYFAQCNEANPGGPLAGTAFFGGPEDSGAFPGLQAEYARVPFGNVGLVKVPAEISDDQAILLSDILPTGYFAGKLAEIKSGDTVAVFGCGPVGLMTILCAEHLGAGRVIAVDAVDSRLKMAQEIGAEVINFKVEDPVQQIRALTGGIGVDRAIDAVGIDAEGGPSQALDWAVEALAKAGTLSVVGVYPKTTRQFAIGQAMNKNLTLNMGNCNHRKYIPRLIDMVISNVIDPARFITQHETLVDAISAYESFDHHKSGWVKVKLEPARDAKRVA